MSGIEELLNHDAEEVDSPPAGEYLRGRRVLVTGAGGSIGSELCRQICRCRPECLLLLGRGEYSIYQIQNELRFRFPGQPIQSVIADVGNPGKMEYLFRTFLPEIVFHAAAHKFLSFIEQNPEEGVLNNVFGTQNIACIARRHRTGKFVLISTDKAVYPTSVLGATKKLAELLVQDLAREGSTEFVNVRFGNVLRSRGSVVPLFEQQIERGGPVTVTHPEMKRYFMSIHEAVHLVLQGGELGRNGDLCVLCMGAPMRILELAETLIRRKGFRPYEDVEIAFTGMGEGEKLEEQMLTEAEARSARRAGKILVCRSEESDGPLSKEGLERLRSAALDCRREEIFDLLEALVPGYRPGGRKGAMRSRRA